MPLTTIDLEAYHKLASEVSELMNSCFQTDIYTPDCVEIIQAAKDYQDGKGVQLVSCAAVRNPIDSEYDMALDMVGTPDEAMALLIQSVKQLIKSGAIVVKPSHKKTQILN